MQELTAEELRVLRLCADTDTHIGSGTQEEYDAFLALESAGLIAKNQEPGNDFYWLSESGKLYLSALDQWQATP